MRQSFKPDILDDAEQEKLFWELNEFSIIDKKKNTKEYQNVRNKLIEQNIRLAKWVTNWTIVTKIPLSVKDKEQMAMLGLIDAVDNFNPSFGCKFSHYACKAIYRAIFRECHNNRDVIMNKELAMISDLENDMLVNLGHKPNNNEIADILGISLDRVSELQTLGKINEKESLDKEESDKNDIETIANNISDGDKLNQDEYNYIIDGVYIDKEDILPEDFYPTDSVSNQAMISMVKQKIKDVLKTLEPREENVLRLRFGLDDETPKTLGEIGAIYSNSRERIRQIEAKALRKLRHPLRSQQLKTLLEIYDELENER